MDSEDGKPISVLRDFVGMYSDMNPEVIPNGGMEMQMNCFSMRTGELVTRGGLVEISLSILDE